MRSKAESLVAAWLDQDSKQDYTDMTFLGEPVLVKLFVQYNTTIPSSAAVERIFSTGKVILKPKKASLPPYQRTTFNAHSLYTCNAYKMGENGNGQRITFFLPSTKTFNALK